MSDYALCSNGHYYPAHLQECPYCTDSKVDLKHTSPDLTKTKLFHSQRPHLAKTNVPDSSETTQQQPYERKITGWLITFSHHPNGQDFRLFEGRNTIGAHPTCDACITSDSLVTGHHLTILFRHNEIKFKDELSTNGTMLNGQFREEGLLHDGDEIKIGHTVLKFRSAL